MSDKQKYFFYVANLGPELGRLLKFKNSDHAQFVSSRKRVEQILEKIFSFSDEKKMRELESVFDLVINTNNLNQKDIDTFFYPISLKVI